MWSCLLAAYFLVNVALFVLSVATLSWMLYAWAGTDSFADRQVWVPRQRAAEPADEHGLSFSLLVPARHEEGVLTATLERLAAIDHGRFEIVVIVGDDDPGTAALAYECAKRYPELIRVVTDEHAEKNKPRALNTGLPHASGDVVAVFDAEDVVHPGLLRAVEQRMVAQGCAVVQAGVQLMNFWSSWFSVRNVLEYYFWYRSRMHFQACHGFIPLGGNTVFVRRSVLEWLSGWDPDCLAEDCDLGVRLSCRGLRVSVLYEPALVTREEAPATLAGLVRQRCRWSQGFLQVLVKREWMRLPRLRQKALAVYTLATPLIQAATGILLPLMLLMVVAGRLRVGLVLVSFAPLFPTLLVIVMECVALADFGRMYGRMPRLRDYLRLVLGAPVYQGVLGYAALRAVLRHAMGQGWDKTAHPGLHLEPAPTTERASA